MNSVPPTIQSDLADFTATRRMVPISVLAVLVGAAGALLAVVLLKLIGFFTNLFYYQRLSDAFASPSGHHLGAWAAVVPVIGALIVGVMARYGSDKIRGHGIPEALEAILLRGSRVEPKVALLKPISAAISIGSGGPFGAEGPIIMTGGAFGSMVAQLFQLTAAERKTLLVAGAAAGMSATFSAPMASVLLAVELLLFELKPRSLVPVALASATALFVRMPLLGTGPIFSVPHHAGSIGVSGLGGAVAIGLLAGALASLLSLSVYASEDLFKKLPIHWMWWPAIGGVVVGLGGLICPRALGVGYDTIEALLNGSLSDRDVLVLVAVKWTIWATFLGSGTSGGVLAPLFMIGAAVGGLAGHALPDLGAGFWPLVTMGAVLGAAMGAPLTGVVFAAEVTRDYNVMLPLLVASVIAHGFTALTMRRSILTEKVARRGYHLTREYAVDSLEVLFVRDVMDSFVNTDGNADAPRVRTLSGDVQPTDFGRISPESPIAHPDEILSAVVRRMAESGHTTLPVVMREQRDQFIGVVTLAHTLKARQRHLEEEQRRERILTMTDFIPYIPGRPKRKPSDVVLAVAESKKA